MRLYWELFHRRTQTKSRFVFHVQTILLNRMARHHGGYIGPGAIIEAIPSLPHGLHGVYISRYASIGPGCRIYQNVTVGEVDGKAPKIGANCLIGAGAVVIGGIEVGDNVRIGAGTVVSQSVPSNCTVVAQPARVLVRGARSC